MQPSGHSLVRVESILGEEPSGGTGSGHDRNAPLASAPPGCQMRPPTPVTSGGLAREEERVSGLIHVHRFGNLAKLALLGGNPAAQCLTPGCGIGVRHRKGIFQKAGKSVMRPETGLGSGEGTFGEGSREEPAGG